MSTDTADYFLRPTFSSDAEDIRLDQPLVAVGCSDAPFAGYPQAQRDELGERHARIIREADRYYLVAMDEGHPTRVNGRQISGASKPLNAGDIVLFGETLSYVVTKTAAASRAETQTVPQKKLKLLLLPKAANGPEAPIAINEFPFLIAKNDGHFVSYEDQCPLAFGFLSRRHAHIFQTGDELWVEDLGSTNGTRLNGNLISNSAHRLNNADELTFGHPTFRFECAIIERNECSDPKDPEGTVLITSAGSFLDIYCDTADPAPEGDPSADDSVASGFAEQARQHISTALNGTATRIKTAWYELPISQQSRSLSILAAGAVVLVLLATAVFWDDRLEAAEQLLSQGRPAEALPEAAGYAQDHPDDKAAQALLDRAFERAVVPDWTAAVANGDTIAANDVLLAALAIAPSQSEDDLTQLLRWITRLAQIAEPVDLGPVTAARSNSDIQALSDEWRARETAYSQLLRRLTDTNPQFASVHSNTTSHLRRLQTEFAAQLTAVSDLHSELDDYLVHQRYEDAKQLLERFSVSQPAIADLHLLAQDLNRYADAMSARARNDIAAYLNATQGLMFTTNLFSRYVDDVMGDRAAASQVHRVMIRAASAWQSGELSRAIDLLKATEPSPFDATVAAQLERYTERYNRFNQLLELVQTDEYPDAVIRFYGSLDEQADRFIYNALHDDFWNHKEQALEHAEQLAEQAAERWASYQTSAEGISGGLRLERDVSDAYRALAATLTEAYVAVNRSERLYRLLNQEVPQTVNQAGQEIASEVQRQRSAISALRSILEPQVAEEKLSLLPVPASIPMADGS